MNYYTKTIIEDIKSFYTNFSLKDSKSFTCVKASLSACIAYLISLEMELGSSYWAPFCCFIMITPYLGVGIEKGVYRIAGTITGAFVAFLIWGFTIQNQFYYTILLFLVSTACYYKYATSRHMGYFWFMIVLAFILITSVSFEKVLSPADFALTAFDRAMNLLIGILVYLLLNYLFKPKYAADELKSKLRQLKTELSAYNREIFTQYIMSAFNIEPVKKQYETIRSLIKAIDALSYNAQFEKKVISHKPTGIDYKRVSDYIDEIMTFHQSVCNLKSVSFQSNFRKQILKIIEIFESIALLDEKINIEKIVKDIKMQLAIIDIKYNKIVKKGRHYTYSTSDTYIFNESIVILKDYITFFILRENAYKEELTESKKDPELYQDEFLGYKKYSFFGKTLFIHKPHMRFAIQTAITLVVVIWAWKFLDLPSDMGTANITIAVMTASLPDYLSSRLKGILRFLGCSIGFLLGCILLFFSIESTLVMLMCVFLVGYFSAMIMLKCPRISYMGLQIFLAFSVAFIPTWGPVMSLESVFMRFISIFFGISVMWIMSILLWNNNYFQVVKTGILCFWKRFNKFKIDNSADYFPSILIEGISLLKFNIDKLTITSSITLTEQSLLKKWCDAVERLLITSRNLNLVSEEYKLFISEINKELFEKINSLCGVFDIHSNDEQHNSYHSIILDNISEIESLKHLIRSNGLLRAKDIHFKQETMRCIVLIKRLLVRLKDINNIHLELLPLLAEHQSS
ncbi:MAG: hypothetical protein A2X47_10090 [Lentisphaerae bacterium GWF2_38_69]|nr:MAG: hypothetical protein A2X47_10090 [Lentisphaerae bacterium GWF2_38_69]